MWSGPRVYRVPVNHTVKAPADGNELVARSACRNQASPGGGSSFSSFSFTIPRADACAISPNSHGLFSCWPAEPPRHIPFSRPGKRASG